MILGRGPISESCKGFKFMDFSPSLHNGLCNCIFLNLNRDLVELVLYLEGRSGNPYLSFSVL